MEINNVQKQHSQIELTRRNTDPWSDASVSPKGPQRISKKTRRTPFLDHLTSCFQTSPQHDLSFNPVPSMQKSEVDPVKVLSKVGQEFAVYVQPGQAWLVGVIQNLGRHHKSEAARKG